jgi:hypothetical protein
VYGDVLVIILSIGHDAERQGASHFGISEWMLATKLVKFIDHPSIIVVDRTLEETVEVINEWPSHIELAAELHFNSHPTATGCETLYCPGSANGQDAAEAFQAEYMQHTVTTRDRGSKEGWYKMKPNTFIDFFLKHTAMPAIILEPEFIQVTYHWTEVTLQHIAKNITLGLLEARRVV